MTKEQIQDKLKIKKARLQLYYAKEEEMLSPNSVQAYGIGPRSVSRYQFDLKNLREQIKDLEEEIEELEGKKNGERPRKAVAIVPQDW